MIKKINEEKFFADYDLALKAKEEFVANKELAIENEKEKVEAVVAGNGYSEVIKEKLIALVVEEKEKEFDLGNIDSKIELFENYLVEVEEDFAEESEDNENETVEEESETQENIENQIV